MQKESTMQKKVISLDTRAMKVIRASGSDIKAIARMINEQGAVLIEDGLEPVNVLSLVNLQLQRLIDGTISKCLNPNCTEIFHAIDFIGSIGDGSEENPSVKGNPLMMTCCDECALEAVSVAAESIVATLRLEIPALEKKIRGTRLALASSAVREGDVVDRSQLHNDDANERIVQAKKLRLANLLEVMQTNSFSLQCKNKHCDEDIPLSVLMNSPESGFCLACKR